MGLLGAVFAVAAVIGPLLGGFVVDHVSWRLIYWVSVPMGALALIVIATRFPKLQKNDQAKAHRLPGYGLVLGITCGLAPAPELGRDHLCLG